MPGGRKEIMLLTPRSRGLKCGGEKNNERAPESSAAAGPPQLVHTDTRLFINHGIVLESAYNISSRA